MKLDWRQGIINVAIMGIEGCWLYALLAIINQQGTGGRLSIPGLLLLYPAAFVLNTVLRRMLRWQILIYIVNVLTMGAGILLMVKVLLHSSSGLVDPEWLLSIPRALGGILNGLEPEFLVVFGGVFLWWLGWRLARLRVTFGITVTEFQFGLAMLLITFFAISQFGIKTINAAPIALSFFFFALTGTALTHAREGAGWTKSLHTRQWYVLLLLTIGFVLVVGLLVGSLINTDLLRLALIPLKWIWAMIVKAVDWFINLFPEPEPAAVPLPDTLMAPKQAAGEDGFQLFYMSETVRRVLHLVWSIGWGILIFLALWRISSQLFSWFRHKMGVTPGAKVEPLHGAFRADILSLFRYIIAKLLGLRFPFNLRRRMSGGSSEPGSVRYIYRQLLLWAKKRGYPRAAFQTPYEYLHILEGFFPAIRGDLQYITEVYVGARYGRSSVSEEELHKLRDSWQRITENSLKL